MSHPEPGTEPASTCSPEFWDALASHHVLIEDNFFDLRSVRLLTDSIQDPVLVVGAGQGLLVAELRNRGFRCDGIDSSPEMIRFARLRRNLSLIQADARALSFSPGTYKSIIYATGVIDFIGEEEQIRAILVEGRRIVTSAGKLFVGFYRGSDAQERFLTRVGLLANHRLRYRQSLKIYGLTPLQMVAWVAGCAGTSRLSAVVMLLRLTARVRLREVQMNLRMQRIFRDPKTAQALMNAAPIQLPYRNAAEITNLFQRLEIPIKQLRSTTSCFIVDL